MGTKSATGSSSQSSSSSDSGDKDFIKDYVDEDPEVLPQPPTAEDFKFEFEEPSTTEEPIPLAAMADEVAAQSSNKKPESTSDENEPTVVNGGEVNGDEDGPRRHQIYLYVKAGSDRECIGLPIFTTSFHDVVV